MNPSIEKWKTWLAEHPINIMTNDADTLVEELYWNYSECNPPINNRTQVRYEQMHPYWERLSTKEQDALFTLLVIFGQRRTT